ncbi:MAG: hypothetical protein DMF60_19715 [Acidobacteria bacterium]|nr:MAG: hypothetical protein DMF60_19715 [Acidobacteriota bacterium]
MRWQGHVIRIRARVAVFQLLIQQASIPKPETLRADPENKLFDRMTRRRLEADALRNSLLAVTGNRTLRIERDAEPIEGRGPANSPGLRSPKQIVPNSAGSGCL